MSEGEVKAKKTSGGIKVEFTRENTELLKSLLIEANGKMRGSNLNYTKLLNWMVAQHPPSLSPQEIEGVQSAFQNEKSFLLWMADEITRAESEGLAPPTIDELMAQRPMVTSPPLIRKPRRTKKNNKPKNDDQETFSDSFKVDEQVPTQDVIDALAKGQN